MSGAALLLMFLEVATRLLALTVGVSGTLKGYATGTYGALAPTTFRDNSGATRTVAALNWNSTGSQLTLVLGGGGIPNSDATFAALNIGGRLFLRSAATFSAPSSTLWQWSGVADPFGGAGSVSQVTIT